MENKLVLINHAIDTEGPLYEAPSATFEWLGDVYGINGLPNTRTVIERLRNREIDLGGIEEDVAEALSPQRMRHNSTWDQVDEMVARCTSPEFRMRLPDSFGGGWVYNWHCLDLVGYEYNPRRRTLGYHAIFDHYREILAEQPDSPDAIHFHSHPVSMYADAHRCATNYLGNPVIWQVIARRIIERNWFPTVFRAGFQAERPDIHWFLEQYIPFDISNMALDDNSELDNMVDFRNGRSGNWRQAPSDWSVYHPDHENYQIRGNCRRSIGRALNILSRVASINQIEMDKAFARANEGKITLVGLCSHDFRDIGKEVDFVRRLIMNSQKKYPEVKFKYCEGIESFRLEAGMTVNDSEALEFEVTLHPDPSDDVPNLDIVTRRGAVFGPQPFFAIETRSRRFIHDNLDFSTKDGIWHYAFHGDTLPIDDVRRIGVAANDKFGNSCIKVLDIDHLNF